MLPEDRPLSPSVRSDPHPDAFAGYLAGLTRRDFLGFCAGMAATMGLSSAAAGRMAEALVDRHRPPVIWLHGQECTGCTESLLRAQHPSIEALILETISLDYHETLNVGAGEQALAHKNDVMQRYRGEYLLVTEGATPTRDGGVDCMVAGEPHLEHVREAAEGAAAIIAIGSCAAWGGVQAAAPNPTGARSTGAVLPGHDVINIPGCPPNPYNFLATVLHLLTFGRPPELDAERRPLFAYGRLVHENCERRPHFDAGRFADAFGDEGHRRGYCLYKLGCKGPETYANCPAVGFGDAGQGAWPVGIGHPCFGCTMESAAFNKPLHAMAELLSLTPPAAFPTVGEPQGRKVTPGAAAVVAGTLGALLGAGATALAGMRRGSGGDGSDDADSAEETT